MKQEYIDKKIGMPDVDTEWAKFEREVIGKEVAWRKPLYWGIAIAASIALVAGIFLFGRDATGPQQLMAEQTAVLQGEGKEAVTSSSLQSKRLQPPPLTPPLEGRGTAAQNNTNPGTVAQNNTNPVTAAQNNTNPVTAAHNNSKPVLLAEAATPTKEENVYDCGEVMPQFPGGDRALLEFIKNNLRYPALAMEYGVRGRVVVTFKIDTLGQASNFKPIKFPPIYDTLYMNRVPVEHRLALKQRIDSLLGEESIRILSLMPRWTPGSIFGKTVSVKYAIPIAFNFADTERQTYLTQMQTANGELQGRIAGLTIVPTAADLGTGNTMRLGGTRVTGKDSVMTGRKGNYDFLVVVNGQPLSEAEQKHVVSSDFYIYFYHRQQLVDSIYIYKGEDSTRPYVEKYGERAKKAVMVIATVPDTLCDAYVQQHPELMPARHRVEGYVVDNDTEKPLPDTWVSCRVAADTCTHYGNDAGAATDSTGHFILWLPRKDIKLQALRAGYVAVRINQPADTALTIHMRPANILKDVKAVGRAPWP